MFKDDDVKDDDDDGDDDDDDDDDGDDEAHHYTATADSIPTWLALFDMPNSNRFDILSISIFSKISLSILISISILFKSVVISTIDIQYRYIEQG